MTQLYERYTNREAATYITSELARTAENIKTLRAKIPHGPLSLELGYMATLDKRNLDRLEKWTAYLTEKLTEVLDEQKPRSL